MTTLNDLSAKIDALSAKNDALPAAIANAVVAALPPQATVDTAAIEAAITNGFAALTTEIKTNVEGVAAAPAPAPEPAPAPAA